MIIERALEKGGLMLGGNVFGWTVAEAPSFDILDAFVGGGGRLIDSADVYSNWVPGNTGGESEKIIGAWAASRGRRNDVLIATKTGIEMNGSKGLSSRRIVSAVEESLKRLQTEWIDLYFAHMDDADTPLEVTLEAFDRLVAAGKVRAIGASNYSVERLQQGLDISAVRKSAHWSVLQPKYNLMDRAGFEGPMQNVCIKHGIAVVPYYGLAAGFLTGKYRTAADLAGKARGGPGAAADYLNARGLKVLAALDAVASETGAKVAQVALAWLAAQPSVTAPIASATSVAQVAELLDALHLDLSTLQLAHLDAASAI